MGRVHSYTSIKSFFICKLAYKYKYIDIIEEIEKPTFFQRGIKLHEEIEHYLRGEPSTLTPEQINIIENFKNQEIGGQLIDVERPYFLTLPIGIQFYGRIDALYKAGDQIYIVDWKSGEAAPDKMQMNYYLLLFHFIERPQVPPIGYFVRFEKKRPASIYTKISYPQNFSEKIREVYKDLIEKIEKIEAETTFSTTYSAWRCEPCSYRSYCPIYKEHKEELLEKLYERTNRSDSQNVCRC